MIEVYTLQYELFSAIQHGLGLPLARDTPRYAVKLSEL